MSWGTAAKLAALFVIGSLVAGALRAYWLLLCPNDVLHGAIWQLITYAFIATRPLQVVFGAVILVSLGGVLESRLGRRRLVELVVGVPAVSAIATTLLAIAFPSLRQLSFAGGAAMISTTWCAYGWLLGRGLASFWGVTVTGDQLAGIGIGLVVLQAALGSPVHVIPEAISIALTFAAVRR